MSGLSVAVMAHPARHQQVEELMERLGYKAELIWDRKDEEWDTARRALLEHDPDASHHLVIQDDAVLCEDFLPGVERALQFTPPDAPVSFYTGRMQPHAEDIERAVSATREAGKTWFAMRGPLWGVAVALPTASLTDLLETNQRIVRGDYDARLGEYYNGRGLRCWYSVPSLVDHRDGPSLLPDRNFPPGRRAHCFIGSHLSPMKVDWSLGALQTHDPSERWQRGLEGYLCSACPHKEPNLASMIIHHRDHHDLGVVDFLASEERQVKFLGKVYGQLPEEVRGTLWVVGQAPTQVSEAKRVRPKSALRVVSRRPKRFTIVDNITSLRYLNGRTGWSLDGAAN